MPCFYCGKRVSIVRQLTDADFCSDEHRQKYHELTRMALNRLVESHEQVSAPARRKGKGQTAATKEHPPSISERLEGPVRGAAERPSPDRQAQPVPEEAAPVPEKRPGRPHRQAPVPIVTPPPVEQPVPPVAGYARLTPPAPRPEETLRSAGSGEIWASTIEIGGIGAPASPEAVPRAGEFDRGWGAAPANRRPDRSRNVRTAALPFACPDLSLPRANLMPVAEDLAAIVAPEPASWVTVALHPSRVAASLQTEPTPKRAPRPAIPRSAAWPGGILQGAELIRPDVPLATGARRAVPGMTRKASAAAFQAGPVLPTRGGKHAPGPDVFQEPPLAGLAPLLPPAAAHGESDVEGFFSAGEIAHLPVHLPHLAAGAAEAGRVLPGHARLEALPMPGVAAREAEARRIMPAATSRFASAGPLLPSLSESLRTKGISHELALMLPALPMAVRGPSKPAAGREDVPPVAPSAKPLAPTAPAQTRTHRIGVGSFRIELPAAAAGNARSTAQPASGRISVRPKAMPRFGLGLPETALASVAPLVAIDLPQPSGRRSAPLTAAVLPTGPKGLAIAQEGFAFQIAGQERVASHGSLPPVCGIRTLAMPTGHRLEAGSLRLPGEELHGPDVYIPGLPAKSTRQAMPEPTAMHTGISAALRKAGPEACEAPLARVRSMVEAGGVPVMLPAPVAAMFGVRLTSAHEAPAAPLKPVAQGSTVTAAGWAAYALARSIPAGPDHAAARRRLGSGAVERLGTPTVNSPALPELRYAGAEFPLLETVRPAVPARFHLRIPETMPPVASAPGRFAGTEPVPIGTVLALSAPMPGLPVFESRITAALGLEQLGPQLPGSGKGHNITAISRSLAAPIELEGIRPPAPLSAPQPALVVARGGVLSTAAAVARNVESQFAAPQAAEFAPARAAFGEQTQALAGRYTLPAGSALRTAVSQRKPGTAFRLRSDSAEFGPQGAELPRPGHLAGVLRLAGAGYGKLQSAAMARAAARQTAGWQPLGSAGAEFKVLCSGLPAVRVAPVASGRFQIEKAPVVSGEKPRPLPPVAVEILRSAVINKESADLAACPGEAPAFRLDVQACPDGRTAVRTVRLAPVFRTIRRPARLPVFGSAKHGKAGMPEAVFVPPDELEDFEDFRTSRIGPGYDSCPVRMVMPVSQPVRDFSLRLPAADLLRTEAAAVTGTARAAAFDYKVPAFRPHLPDGWVDTVPLELDPAAAEPAQEQNWEPLVGAIKNATRFFKFMCLGIGGLLILSTITAQSTGGMQSAYQDKVGAGCPQQTLQAGNK